MVDIQDDRDDGSAAMRREGGRGREREREKKKTGRTSAGPRKMGLHKSKK